MLAEERCPCTVPPLLGRRRECKKLSARQTCVEKKRQQNQSIFRIPESLYCCSSCLLGNFQQKFRQQRRRVGTQHLSKRTVDRYVSREKFFYFSNKKKKENLPTRHILTDNAEVETDAIDADERNDIRVVDRASYQIKHHTIGRNKEHTRTCITQPFPQAHRPSTRSRAREAEIDEYTLRVRRRSRCKRKEKKRKEKKT